MRWPADVECAAAFTPSPAHDDQMMDELVEVLEKLWTPCNIKRVGGVAA